MKPRISSDWTWLVGIGSHAYPWANNLGHRPTPVAPGLKVGKKWFSEESQGAVTLWVLLGDKNRKEPPPASCLLLQPLCCQWVGRPQGKGPCPLLLSSSHRPDVFEFGPHGAVSQGTHWPPPFVVSGTFWMASCAVALPSLGGHLASIGSVRFLSHLLTLLPGFYFQSLEAWPLCILLPVASDGECLTALRALSDFT